MSPALVNTAITNTVSKGVPAPSSKIDASTLPLAVIDLSEFDPQNRLEESRKMADEITRASHDVGFFYLKGLNMSQEQINNMFRIAAEYFAEPSEEKTPYWMDSNHIGYMGLGGQTLDPSGISDNKELYNMAKWGSQHPGHSDRKHPRVLMNHWAELEEFSRICHGLALKCLQLIAIGLRIPDSADGTPGYLAFQEAHSYDSPSGDTFRFLHYPPPVATTDKTEEQAGVRVGAGDIIQFWSSGYLKSTMHRVVPSPKEHLKYSRRYSVAYFARPGFSTPLTPISSPVIDGYEGKKVEASEDTMAPEFRSENGGVVTAGEWLVKRATKSFTKD
ncbi:hypothetical protein HDU93_001493 [Gonapodya sp. JEL0774]|nr:hypothetical protein HDU93_001493 [Gonapodya sp. JEL0774]